MLIRSGGLLNLLFDSPFHGEATRKGSAGIFNKIHYALGIDLRTAD